MEDYIIVRVRYTDRRACAYGDTRRSAEYICPYLVAMAENRKILEYRVRLLEAKRYIFKGPVAGN